VIVGNAHHISNVPGRKTDVKDSEWLANLVRHGLIARSFVPPASIRMLRDLLRFRRKLVESRTSERNRVVKLLEIGNIKLSSVATDVFGVSGMLMLRALAEGQATPAEMAELAKGQLRKKLESLALCLQGALQEHHRFLLRLQLRRLDFLATDLETLDSRIDDSLTPYLPQLDALQAIPGISAIAAATVIAEMGVDMTVFRDARHLSAWAGLAPGNDESGGKKRNARVRQGNVYLKTILVEAAWASSRKKGTFFRDKFHRLRNRRGARRAAVAIAHKILIAAHAVLSGKTYRELGGGYLDSLHRRQTLKNLTRRIERLGFDVRVTPKAA
jgi:transposase